MVVILANAGQFLAGTAHATATITLTPVYMGWYRQEPSGVVHLPDNTNFIAGFADSQSEEWRDFFVFDLSPLKGTAISATFQATLEYFGVGFDDPTATTATWTMHDVTTPIDSLRSTATPSATFNDLGTGLVFGVYNFTRADNSRRVSVPLNDAGLAAIQTHQGQWAFGGSVTHSSPGQTYVFNGADVQSMPRLVVTVPEPSTAALLVIGCVVALAVRCRR